MKHKALTLAFLVGAALLFSKSASAATQKDIAAPAGSGRFGSIVTVLPNGNIVVSDPAYDAPGPITDVGAVYLYTATGEMISVLTGSTANDLVGNEEVIVLANGNYVVHSSRWNNGGAAEAGAITWCSATAGCSGTVSAANSLIGSTAGDGMGAIVTGLPNGHYVARSQNWDDGAAKDAGAVTWCNGTSGCTGAISSANSLVGTSAGDRVGNVETVPVANSNYVTGGSLWDNGSVVDAGASVWCDGAKGCVGPISSAIALYGTTKDDRVSINNPVALANGKYVVRSRNWSNGAAASAGAATLCSGETGCTGPITPANSLVGAQKDDRVGSRVTALTNGNYVVYTDLWDNGTVTNAGAVTWCNGDTGCIGEVSPANSLVGERMGDTVGTQGVVALANGNYVVNSPGWNNGGISTAGAVTWCNGAAGCTGTVSAANSLVGSVIGDNVGIETVALTNGNYVVRSAEWNNGATANVGAATWCNGTTGRTGPVSASNSLIGSSADDQVGFTVTPLTNGNYVVASPSWKNGSVSRAGAATWCNGADGCTGTVSPANSLVGSTANDLVSHSGVLALRNGNYVVASSFWSVSDVGAITWGNGTTGVTGEVSPGNSLIGSNLNDRVGQARPLADGNYLAISADWDNGSLADAGAITFGRGNAGTVGTIDASMAVLGLAAGQGSFMRADYNPQTGQLIVGRPGENIVSLFTPKGAELVVTTTDDHNDDNCTPEDCTLREAIAAANALPGDNTITFAPGVTGVVQLGGALPVLTSNVTVQGPGADLLTVRRNSVGVYRIFTISNGTTRGPEVTIAGLTISDGIGPGLMFPQNSGGGILNERGTLTLRGCAVIGNHVSDPEFNAGGGVFSYEGTLIIEECTFTGNSAMNGGAIATIRRTTGNASLVLRNSTLNDNHANGGGGGGVYNEARNNGSGATAVLSNCTLSTNRATENGFLGGTGGAILNFGSTGGRADVFVQDCTLSGNNAPAGGGIYNNNFGAEAIVRLQNTILKTGTVGRNFLNSSGSIVSLGHNLTDDDASSATTGTGPGGFLNATGDIRNTDPLLGALADNEGPTLTHALLNGSPAIDAGANVPNLNFDQRGYVRIGNNDIGAFELGGTLPPPPTPNPSATPSPSATPPPGPAGNRFANISTRLRVETGDNVLIGGFIVTGSSQKRIIIRALGPSLPVGEALANPVLELYDGNGQFIASNDNWQEAANAQEIIDSTIAPANGLESAILSDVDPGAYTAVVRDAADGAGVGLVEVYDLGATQDAKLANISTRGRVLTGDNVMIGGLIVTGSSAQSVIIRAIGPSLPVDGKLEDPLLELFDANGSLLIANDNWKDAQQAEIEASTIPPSNDLEAAIVTSLPPAAYTAVVRGANDTTGVALVEAYALEQ